MSKYLSNSKRYKYPLPIHPLDNLPQLLPHNPVSWLYWLYCYISSTNLLAKKIDIEVTNGHRITVPGEEDMLYLWNNGFFGTARLSRSEPTWKARTLARLGIDESFNALEKVTEKRRHQRLAFKKERRKFEAIRLDLRKKGVLESEILDKERQFLRELRDQELILDSEDYQVREEDDELLLNDGSIVNLEVLELMPVEAIFLTFALPVLRPSVAEIAELLLGPKPTYTEIHNLITQYVAYHHYRSHGWCVRSGIKFGCEYLLYKRGPPFQHAEFAVMVLDYKDTPDYTWYSGIARVIGGAKKSLILCYVEPLLQKEELMSLWDQKDFEQVFASHRVGEILYRRWVPGKNRD